MKTSIKGTDAKAMLQDLKSNRKVQVALGALVVMVWFLWPTSPTTPARGAAARRTGAPLGDRQARELQKLPDLSSLDKAGELPTEDRMLRDLFLFEGPQPPPPTPKPVKPPPPPTEEELAAARKAQALAQEHALQESSRPKDLRFLGYLGTVKAGRLGAFMKGEEPVTLKQGDLVNPSWRLVKVTEAFAEFQNLKYADMKQKIEAVELRGAAGAGASNEF